MDAEVLVGHGQLDFNGITLGHEPAATSNTRVLYLTAAHCRGRLSVALLRAAVGSAGCQIRRKRVGNPGWDIHSGWTVGQLARTATGGGQSVS